MIHNGTATSIEAAKAIYPHRTRLQLQIIAALYDAYTGLTRQELQAACNMSGDTLRPRVAELLDDQIIYEMGERPTASGRPAKILHLHTDHPFTFGGK